MIRETPISGAFEIDVEPIRDWIGHSFHTAEFERHGIELNVVQAG